MHKIRKRNDVKLMKEKIENLKNISKEKKNIKISKITFKLKNNNENKNIFKNIDKNKNFSYKKNKRYDDSNNNMMITGKNYLKKNKIEAENELKEKRNISKKKYYKKTLNNNNYDQTKMIKESHSPNINYKKINSPYIHSKLKKNIKKPNIKINNIKVEKKNLVDSKKRIIVNPKIENEDEIYSDFNFKTFDEFSNFFSKYYERIPLRYKRSFEFNPNILKEKDYYNLRFKVVNPSNPKSIIIFKLDYNFFLNKKFKILHFSCLKEEFFNKYVNLFIDFLINIEKSDEISLSIVHYKEEDKLIFDKNLGNDLKKIGFKWKIIKNDEHSRRVTLYSYKSKNVNNNLNKENEYFNKNELNLIEPIKFISFGIFSNSERILSGRSKIDYNFNNYLNLIDNRIFIDDGYLKINPNWEDNNFLTNIDLRNFPDFEINKFIKLDNINLPINLEEVYNMIFYNKEIKYLKDDNFKNNENYLGIMRNYIRPKNFLIFNENNTSKLLLKFSHKLVLKNKNLNFYLVKTLDLSIYLFFININDKIIKNINNNPKEFQLINRDVIRIIKKNKKKQKEKGFLKLSNLEMETPLVMYKENPKIILKSKIKIDIDSNKDYIMNEEIINKYQQIEIKKPYIIGLVKLEIIDKIDLPLLSYIVK